MKSIVGNLASWLAFDMVVWCASIWRGNPLHLWALLLGSLTGWLLMGLLMFAIFITRRGEWRRFWAFCGYGKRAAVFATVVYVVCWPVVADELTAK